MKKLVLKLSAIFILVFAMTFITLHLFTSKEQVKAEEANTTTSLEILKNNVSYSDSIYILYAVSYEGFEYNKYTVEMLFWNSPQSTYLKGTEDGVGTQKGKTNINGKQCLVFYSEGLAAKHMTDDLYSRAYVNIDGKEYYSEVVKFSVLEYVYKMKEEATLNPHQQRLLNTLLQYGGAAQDNFDYNTNKKADATYYKITVKEGMLPDGFKHGRYQLNEKVVIKPLSKPGQKFSHWLDQNGIIVSYDKEFEITVTDKNEYTAIYKDISNVSSQLKMEYEVEYDATTEDLDLPNAVSFDVDGETTILDITWDLSKFVVNQIGVQKLYATLVDETAYEEYGISKEDIYCEVNVLPYTYELDQETGNYILTGYFGTDELVEIPSIYKNTYITKIAPKAFNEVLTLKEVVIPTTIEEIGLGAFYYCDNIEKMTIPFTGKSKDVYRTEDYSYFGYIFGATLYENQKDIIPLNLYSVTLTEGATIVGQCAFYDLSQITELNVPSTLEYIHYNAFFNCTSLTSFYINENLKGIDLQAFSGCTNLKKVYAENLDILFTIDTGLGYGGGSNFYTPFENGGDLYIDNKLVTEIVIPSYVTKMNEFFAGCSSIEKITISKSVEDIQGAFHNMKNLKVVIIEENSSLTEISQEAFQDCVNLTNIELPSGIKEISHRAFQGCASLEKVIIPEGVTSLHTDVFYGCCSLKEVVLPSTLEVIDYGTFAGCSSLTSIIIPTGITKIASSTFTGCERLTEVSLPSTVATIETDAFNGCVSLTEIELPSRLRSIGYNAFENCKNLFYIKNNSDLEVTIGSTENGYVGYYAIEIVDKNGNKTTKEGYSYETTEDGFLFECSDSANKLLAYVGDEDTITLPLTFKGESYEIYKFTSNKNIIIPEGLTSIGTNAFFNCNGDIISIPSTVVSIGANAFEGCTSEIIWINPTIKVLEFDSLSCYGGETLVIPGSVEYLGSCAIFGCENLKTIVISEGVKQIYGDAIYSCTNLEKIIIPSTIVRISCDALIACDKLKELKYNGSLNDWNNVEVYGGEASFLNLVTFDYENPVYDWSEDYSSVTAYKNHKTNNSLNIIETVNTMVTVINESTCLENGIAKYSTNSFNHFGFEIQEVEITLPILDHNFIDGICNKCFEKESGYGLEYELTEDGNSYIVKRVGTFSDSELVIPEKHNNKPVVSIDEKAFFNCSFLNKVVIPNSVLSIGESAFEGCNNLYELVLPFVGASRDATSHEGPLGYIFGYYGASSENYDEGIYQGSYSGLYYHYFIPYSLKKVTVTDDETLAKYAFYNSNVSHVYLEKTKVIEYSAFSNCDFLVEVELPKCLTTINERAFYFSQSLRNIYLSNNVSYVGYAAFYYCNALQILCEAKTQPETWDVSWNYSNCVTLWNVTEVYKDDLMLAKIDNKLHIVGYYGTESSLEIPSYYNDMPITTISSKAFTYIAANLNNLYIPATVKNIKGNAFVNTTIILYFECDSPQQNWDTNWNANGNIVVWDYKNNNVASDGFIYIKKDQLIYQLNEENAVLVFGSSIIENVVIHSSITYNDVEYNVTSIKDSAFKNNNSIKTVFIPNSITYIGRSAFYGCYNLEKVIISTSVEIIEDYAFYNDTKPKPVKIYSMADSLPSGWSNLWKDNSKTTVLFGYINEDITYQFVVNGGNEIENITSKYEINLPDASYEGMYFGGWYDNAEFNGNPVDITYYSSVNTKLYAKWIEISKANEYFDGSSFSKALIFDISNSLSVEVSNDVIFVQFIANESKVYSISSRSGDDPYCVLYDSFGNKLESDEDSGTGYNFSFEYELVAGNKYYLALSSSEKPDSFYVDIE